MRTRSNVRTLGVLLALSIGAAACGSTETSSTPTLDTQVTSAPVADEPSAESSTEEADSTEADSTEADSASDPDEAAAPAVNLFPDIDVLNIADGTTVNLAAELGGADKATLLWFFAPH